MLKFSRNKLVAMVKITVIGLIVTFSLLFILIPQFTGYKWIFVSGESVNIKLGLISMGPPQTLIPGEYVMLSWKGVDHNGIEKLRQGLSLIKQIVCLPGQHLRVTVTRADCDGNHVGHIRNKTIDGKTITPALFDGLIPPGQVFLMGEHYYSYDSRYFGLVPQEWIQGVIRFHI